MLYIFRDATYIQDFKDSFSTCKTENLHGKDSYFKINKLKLGNVSILMRFNVDCVKLTKKQKQQQAKQFEVSVNSVDEYLPNSDKRLFIGALTKTII